MTFTPQYPMALTSRFFVRFSPCWLAALCLLACPALAQNTNATGTALTAPVSSATITSTAAAIQQTQNQLAQGQAAKAAMPGAPPNAPMPPAAYPLFVPYNTNSQAACGSGGVPICQTVVPVPSQLPVGAVMNLSLPPPLKRQPFTVTCVEQNGIFSFQVTDQSQVTCEPQTCAAQSVMVCNHKIDVPGGAKVGDIKDVSIPPAMLNDAVYNLSAVRVRCTAGDADTDPAYVITDSSGLSCNNFTCADATVRLCGVDVPVKGGAHMGEMQHQTMPPPFAPDDFVVQCLGSEGKPPAYQSFNITGVTCNKTQ